MKKQKLFFKLNVRKSRITVIILVLLCDVIIWSGIWGSYFKGPKRLNDIAYDVNKRYGYTVYVEEEKGYEPYLVLTNNYNGDGNVLLLRKYMLDEEQPLNREWDSDLGYKNSHIDRYLNNEYFAMLSADVRNLVVESYLEPRRGIKSSKAFTRRKVFLLSYEELIRKYTSSRVDDGRQLKYFKEDSGRLIAGG